MHCANIAYTHMHVSWSQCMHFKTGHQITTDNQKRIAMCCRSALAANCVYVPGGGESVQPEMDHGASKEKAERCHASRRWGNVNRVTVVLIIMAACCRGSGWGDFNYQSSLKPCVMPCKKYRGGRGKNPWHFLKIKRGVRAWSANSCAIWSNTATHCRDQIPSHLTVLCTGFRQNRAFFPFLCWLLGKICRIL